MPKIPPKQTILLCKWVCQKRLNNICFKRLVCWDLASETGDDDLASLAKKKPIGANFLCAVWNAALSC